MFDSWGKIAPVTVTNAPTVDDFPVRVTVAATVGMAADFSDLRFADTDGATCPYWIESKIDSTVATVWVKIPATSTFYLFYDNDSATSAASGPDVFDLFDDFSVVSLNTSIWDTYSSGAGIDIADGTLTVTGAATQQRGIKSKTSFGTNYAVRSRCDLPRVQNCPLGFVNADGNRFTIWSPRASGSEYTDTYNGTYESKTYTDVTGTRIKEIRRIGSSSVKFSIADSVKTIHTVRIPTESCLVQYYSYQNAGVGTFDWIAVRKTQATDPTCTIGTAEANNLTETDCTRYLSASITETGGVYHYTDTVTATVYRNGEIARTLSTDDVVGATVYRDASIPATRTASDTAAATRYLTITATDHGGLISDTLVATRYLSPSITETRNATETITGTGWEMLIDGDLYGTEHFINLQIRDRLNQVPRFDFRAHSLDDDDITHLKAGATIAIYYNGVKRCEGFIERFDEQQSSWFYDCTGYGVGRFLDHRRSDVPALYPVGVQGENTVKDIVTYIVNTSCGYPTAGETGWTIQGESGPDLLIFKIQNQKAMEHVAQLVQLADMDWFASFGEEGRVLTLGDASCVTHTATNLKLGRDIIMSEEVTDLSKVANNIVIQSKDYFGNTILSSIGDYTNVCTVASSETLLKYDAESGTTLLYVFDHSDFPSSGSLYVSTESVTYVGKSDPASALHPHFYGLTTTASHVAYEPVLFRDGFYITGATAPFLDASPGTIRVGREDISYASVYSVDATTACVSGTLTRGSNYYAHGREAPVFDTTYTLASPTPGTSVATYGRKDEVISGIGYQDMNSLDLAAYGVLRRKCGWPTWGQGMIVGGDFPTTFSTTPKVGDWVIIEEETSTATNLFRITGLDYDMMRGTITINWGASEEYAVSDLKKSDIAMNQAMS